jgi:hypothetical protein
MANLDLDALAEEINLPKDLLEEPETYRMVPEMRIEKTDISEPDKIISNNISKANAILDHVMTQIENGDDSAKMIEAVSKLIDSINNSTSQLYGNQFNIANLQLKAKALQLKERQIGMIEKTGGVKNQNVIFTDRETMLKMLKEADTKLIEG